MKKRTTIIIFVLFMILLINAISVISIESGHMHLLAVSMDGNETVGSIADLYLDVRPGSGRIFIDSYPLTKVDTQFSTRYANKVACDFINYDCTKYDFFYTIAAKSPIIGGPSAGAAISILTISVLLEKPLNENIALTGTINSGGLIGPIGGIVEKIHAAKDEGITKVLIPRVNSLNATEFLKIANETGIEIVEVSTIDEALYEFVGIPKTNLDIIVDPKYTQVMREVAASFCEETNLTFTGIKRSMDMYLTDNESAEIFNISKTLYEKGTAEYDKGNYYSSASYCFGAGVKNRYILLKILNQTQLNKTLHKTEESLLIFEKDIDALEKNNLWDMQTYMIVKERIIESRENLKDIKSFDNISYSDLAYAIERFKSAKSWSMFFNADKNKETFEKIDLKTSCAEKITETDTYLDYARYITAIDFKNIQEELDFARIDYAKGNYELCLFKASTAKAETTLILTGMALDTPELSEYLNETIISVKNIIAKVDSKDSSFPIIGYSYYEYAQVLKEDDPVSSLLYLEYASELSNLNLYFSEKKYDNHKNFNFTINYRALAAFFLGIVAGVFLTLMFLHRKKQKKDKAFRKIKKGKKL